MKKQIFVFLILLLVCAVRMASADPLRYYRLPEEDLQEYHCEELGFTTRVPAEYTPLYDPDRGLMIYTEQEGKIPFVRVFNTYTFDDPADYLGREAPEYLEETYGKGYLGTSGVETWKVAGREMYAASFTYALDGYKVTEVALIEKRESGDVSFSCKYHNASQKKTMAALEAAVRYYVGDAETDRTPWEHVVEDEWNPAVVDPIDRSGEPLDLKNGTFQAEITDFSHLDENYITVTIYREDLYPVGAVDALQPGDKVRINGSYYTVNNQGLDTAVIDGVYRIFPDEGFEGYMGFSKAKKGYYYAEIGSWHVSSPAEEVTVSLPLPKNFTFDYDLGYHVYHYDRDEFIQMCREGDESVLDMKPRNTTVTFRNGKLVKILHEY